MPTLDQVNEVMDGLTMLDAHLQARADSPFQRGTVHAIFAVTSMPKQLASMTQPMKLRTPTGRFQVINGSSCKFDQSSL